MSNTHSSCVLILGGARSGKSRYAVRSATERGGDAVTFIATASRGDPDFDARIARHVKDRPGTWTTVESTTDLAAAIASVETGRVVIVDCLTLWVARLLQDGQPLEGAWDAAEAALRQRGRPAILVSNEVGLSVHPSQAIGLRFRDELGWINQRAAALADEVVFLIAGLPLYLKGAR